ncbi:MAG: porin [Limnohabitans sp.]
MKKSLIALAVMAASGAAMAQSSVTIWGVVDAAYSRGSSDVNSVTRMVTSGIGSSQLGFRGVEDLGGGMSASFWLEASVGNDSGAGGATTTNNQTSGMGSASTALGSQGLTFARRSTVSLIGGFGEIRLGRDYTPQFWNWTAYDPFGTNGVGTTRTMLSSVALGGTTGGVTGTSVRASNSITYLFNHGPNATYASGGAGLHAAVQTYFGEMLSNAAGGTSKDGSGSGIRVGYNAGPLSLAVGYGQTKFAAGNMTMTNYGGAYDMGVARVMAQITKDKLGAVSGDGKLLGVTAPMGAGQLRASYSTYQNNTTNAESKQTAFGYVHNLSKRTRAYATYARVGNSNGAAVALGGATGVANKPSTGIDIGMNHSF